MIDDLAPCALWAPKCFYGFISSLSHVSVSAMPSDRPDSRRLADEFANNISTNELNETTIEGPSHETPFFSGMRVVFLANSMRRRSSTYQRGPGGSAR